MMLLLNEDPTTLSESDRLLVEIRVLRAFYDAWVEFHSIPTDDKWKRKHQQMAAQRIVRARETVMRFDAMYKQEAEAANA